MYEWDWLILLGVVVLCIFIYAGKKKKKTKKRKDAIKILNERYAKGEISKEEYLEHKEILQSKDKGG